MLVNTLFTIDDSLAPNARATKNIQFITYTHVHVHENEIYLPENTNVTAKENKSGNGAIDENFIGICCCKKFDIALLTNASRYVKSPFTTLADPKNKSI